MHQTDVCIAGAGIIGLSLALELDRRRASVTIVERDTPLAQASQAAAGMLAAQDPENPPLLSPLAELSLKLYPAFLTRIEHLSRQKVPFQTTHTYQSVDTPSLPISLPSDIAAGPHTFTLLDECSLDPRQLAPALLSAVRRTTIRILSHTTIESIHPGKNLLLQTTRGPLEAHQLIHATGAWYLPRVTPRKGQMLAVRIPPSLPLDYVLRTPDVYIVPRTQGPRSGQAIIGATVEDAGFDTTTHPASLAHLRSLAAQLLPILANEIEAPTLDQWAGLRPYTANHLPFLGHLTHNQFVAAGHYRNGMLLAPATAHVLAQLLTGETPAVDLTPFSTRSSGQTVVPPIFAQPSMTNL